MPKCAHCRKKGLVPLGCPGCQKSFCPSCIQLEKHACVGAQDLVQQKKGVVDKALMDAKAPLRPKIEI